MSDRPQPDATGAMYRSWDEVESGLRRPHAPVGRHRLGTPSPCELAGPFVGERFEWRAWRTAHCLWCGEKFKALVFVDEAAILPPEPPPMMREARGGIRVSTLYLERPLGLRPEFERDVLFSHQRSFADLERRSLCFRVGWLRRLVRRAGHQG